MNRKLYVGTMKYMGKILFFLAKKEELDELVDGFLQTGKWLYFDEISNELLLLDLSRLKEIYNELAVIKSENAIESFDDFIVYKAILCLKMVDTSLEDIIGMIEEKYKKHIS